MISSSNDKARVAGVSFFLFCVALFLTAYSSRNPALANIGSILVDESLRPVQIATQSVLRGISGVWSSYIGLVGVRLENERLRSELARLQGEKVRLVEHQKENERLRELLALRSTKSLDGVVANVIGYDPVSLVQAVVIDRGSQHGIQQGLPVVEGSGVVGQVISVSPHTAQVLLLIDHASGIDGLIQATRARGIVEGSGGGYAQWRFVLREEAVGIGDLVVTSGMDGVFPRGLLIGAVIDLEGRGGGLFHQIEIKPAVNFSKLETVLVLKPATAESEETEE